MKPRTMLTIASLLSILLFSIHLADDIVRGFEPGQAANLTAIPIFVVWMYGTLILSGRLGYALTFLGNLLSLAAPILHFRGAGVGIHSSIAKSDGAILFIWTALALGVTALFSVILAARALWSPQWAESPVAGHTEIPQPQA